MQDSYIGETKDKTRSNVEDSFLSRIRSTIGSHLLSREDPGSDIFNTLLTEVLKLIKSNNVLAIQGKQEYQMMKEVIALMKSLIPATPPNQIEASSKHSTGNSGGEIKSLEDSGRSPQGDRSPQDGHSYRSFRVISPMMVIRAEDVV